MSKVYDWFEERLEIQSIADELNRTNDPERWLNALEIECN